jgi:hypothetical protein
MKMKKINFSIKIKAPATKVWNALWNEADYKKWTSVFSEGSHAESDWKEGSKILFLDGKGEGMYSMIEKKVPGRQMTFKHMGVVHEGIEQPADEQTMQWSGAKENYYLDETNGVTELKVDMDTTEDFEKYFKDTFPKALQVVKQISEN